MSEIKLPFFTETLPKMVWLQRVFGWVYRFWFKMDDITTDNNLPLIYNILLQLIDSKQIFWSLSQWHYTVLPILVFLIFYMDLFSIWNHIQHTTCQVIDNNKLVLFVNYCGDAKLREWWKLVFYLIINYIKTALLLSER